MNGATVNCEPKSFNLPSIFCESHKVGSRRKLSKNEQLKILQIWWNLRTYIPRSSTNPMNKNDEENGTKVFHNLIIEIHRKEKILNATRENNCTLSIG